MRRAVPIVALVLASGGAAFANPLDVFGLGARAQGLAGAHTAATTDSSANYYNPAALAAVPEKLQIDVGYQVATPSLALGGKDQHVDATAGIATGLVAPGDLGRLHFAFGVALFLPDERVTRVRSLPAQAPRFIYYDNRPQRIFLGTNLAVRVLPGLFVGGGMAFMSRTKGDVILRGRVGFPDAEDTELRLGLDVDLVAVRYPQAGVLWQPRDWLRLGLSYRHEFQLELDQGFVVRGNVGPKHDDPVLTDGYLAVRSISTDLFQPAQVTLGASAELPAGLLATLDLQWARWSRFRTPGSMVRLDYDLKDFNSLVMLPTAQPLGPAGFRDVLSPRVGVEKRLGLGAHAMFFRAGYAFEPTPVPEQRGETNLADGDKHQASFGLGAELEAVHEAAPRHVTLDVSLTRIWVSRVQARKLDPANDVGDWVADGHLWSSSVTLRVGF